MVESLGIMFDDVELEDVDWTTRVLTRTELRSADRRSQTGRRDQCHTEAFETSDEDARHLEYNIALERSQYYVLS